MISSASTASTDRGLAEVDAEVGRDLFGQHAVRVAGEQHGVEQHGVGFQGAGCRSGQGEWTREVHVLAGEEGLEPSHVGIKIRCLNQLGDSPTQDCAFTPPLKLFSARPSQQGMLRQTPTQSSHPARWHCLQHCRPG